MRENKMKKIRIAAAGDNCMDVYDKENKAFPGGNINYYDKRSTGAESYRLLADEVIHRGDEE